MYEKSDLLHFVMTIKKWAHLWCTNLSSSNFISLSADSNSWYNSKCLAQEVPFNNLDDDLEFKIKYIFNLNTGTSINASILKLCTA